MRTEECVACGAPAEKFLVATSGATTEDGAPVYDIMLDFCDYCVQDDGVMIMEIEREKRRMAAKGGAPAMTDAERECRLDAAEFEDWYNAEEDVELLPPDDDEPERGGSRGLFLAACILAALASLACLLVVAQAIWWR